MRGGEPCCDQPEVIFLPPPAPFPILPGPPELAHTATGPCSQTPVLLRARRRMAQDPKVDLVLDGVNSQESDTFGSLDQLPEAGLGSQMTDAASQEVPFEVDSGSQSQSQSQMSTDAAEPAAEAEALQGNFPAVNIAPANKASPPVKKPSTKDGEAALAFLKAAVARGKNPPAKDKDGKGASPNKAAGNGKGAPPMEAEVDAADVLLSLSMSAARRSGKNPAEVLPAGATAAAAAAAAQLPQRKRCNPTHACGNGCDAVVGLARSSHN